MSDWRSKEVSADDWASFRVPFEEVFNATLADRKLAVFIRRGPHDHHTILIPAHHAAEVEILSPGDWQDYDDPELDSWTMLAGNGTAPDDFGLPLGSGR